MLAMLRALHDTPAALRRPQYEVSNNALLAAFVRDGLAVAVLGGLAARHPALQALGFRPIAGPAVDRTLMLQVRRGRTLAPPAATLRRAVQRASASLRSARARLRRAAE